MAQGAPEYGRHDGSMAVREFLDRTVGRLYRDDTEELAKLAPVTASYAKLHVHDVDDLEAAYDDVHDHALSAVVAPAQVPGLKRQIYKFLGARGNKHVPPPGRSVPQTGACLSLLCLSGQRGVDPCACAHCLHVRARRAHRHCVYGGGSVAVAPLGHGGCRRSQQRPQLHGGDTDDRQARRGREARGPSRAQRSGRHQGVRQELLRREEGQEDRLPGDSPSTFEQTRTPQCIPPPLSPPAHICHTSATAAQESTTHRNPDRPRYTAWAGLSQTRHLLTVAVCAACVLTRVASPRWPLPRA